MSSFWSKWVVCPYYHKDVVKDRKIICDGLAKNCVTETVFRNKKQTETHLKEVCCSYDYKERCYIAFAHEHKAENE